MQLHAYETWVFDCDGVLLDSNGVKSNAMYEAALPFGEPAAQALLEYHRIHGGVSRFRKFDYLFRELLGWTDFGEVRNEALARFADLSREGLMKASEAPGLRELLSNIGTSGSHALVVSGGMQTELCEVFRARDLDKLFADVYGSPDTKTEILEREMNAGAIRPPALFVGDSRYDYEAADSCGLDFAFVSAWTEFRGWSKYFADKNVALFGSLADINARYQESG